MSTVIFHDQLTPINISGLVVTISGIIPCPSKSLFSFYHDPDNGLKLGIGLYNYLKYNQFLENKSTASSSSPISNINQDSHDRRGSFIPLTGNARGGEEEWNELDPMLSPGADGVERSLKNVRHSFVPNNRKFGWRLIVIPDWIRIIDRI
jgi:hypothetical protein